MISTGTNSRPCGPLCSRQLGCTVRAYNGSLGCPRSDKIKKAGTRWLLLYLSTVLYRMWQWSSSGDDFSRDPNVVLLCFSLPMVRCSLLCYNAQVTLQYVVKAVDSDCGDGSVGHGEGGEMVRDRAQVKHRVLRPLLLFAAAAAAPEL